MGPCQDTRLAGDRRRPKTEENRKAPTDTLPVQRVRMLGLLVEECRNLGRRRRGVGYSWSQATVVRQLQAGGLAERSRAGWASAAVRSWSRLRDSRTPEEAMSGGRSTRSTGRRFLRAPGSGTPPRRGRQLLSGARSSPRRASPDTRNRSESRRLQKKVASHRGIRERTPGSAKVLAFDEARFGLRCTKKLCQGFPRLVVASYRDYLYAQWSHTVRELLPVPAGDG